MHKGIFSRLAKQNIRNNKSTYIPYMITCIFCIAMIYMMEFLRDCPTLDQAVRQADEVRMIVFTGEIVVEIFCIIFLIYSNSFLMKRRQKEIGLYNILGLERNHIGIVMFLETIITSIGSLAGGIAAGIIGSKLALLLLLKLLHIPSVLGFYISVKGIFTCLFMFGIIFLMILFLNLAKIHLSRPVELLRGNNTGEKEPVVKWLMALIGFICLGAGYYLAVTTESPIKAITIFLLAVILVMAGTYLLFTAGSIVILKFLRRRKSFYYRTGNFISISGMLYRMKQNAIGLASICILSTGVLLMIAMTVSIYFGMNDIMLNRYPYDVDMSVTSISEEECQTAIEAFEKAIADNKVPVEKSVEEIYLDIVCSKNGDQILIKPANTIRNSDSVLVLSLLDQAEYERLTGISANLNDGEIFAWYPSAVQKDSVTVDETESSVGDFNVDIYASETGTDRKIIIENQLEDTDHDHLGKLITYASGKDADVVIWVVKHAREEHKAAVEWLNNHTDDKIGFFLCEIKLFQIGDSDIAPSFTVVERPNDWTKEIKKTTATNPTQQQRLEYWQAFNDYAFQNAEFNKAFNKRKPTTDHWMDFSIGSSACHIAVSQIQKRNAIDVELYINDDKELFRNLLLHKDEIESVMGLVLDWRELPERKASRIIIEKEVTFDNRATWSQQFDYIMDVCMKMKKAFKKYL